MTHIIKTTRGNNIGQNIINYLTSKGIYGKVEITTIDTKRDVAQRINITTLKTTIKA